MERIEERIAATGVQVEGTFDVQRFFDTLALILSEKEKVKITVKVIQPEKEKQCERVS